MQQVSSPPESWVILGIESSCDDTAAAIVRGDGHVLAHKIASQVGKLVLAGIQIASQVGKLILAGIHKRRAKKFDQYRELHRNVISNCLPARSCFGWELEAEEHCLKGRRSE